MDHGQIKGYGIGRKNERLTEEEKHYIRFVLKVSSILDAVLNHKPIENLLEKLRSQYETVAEEVDREKLNRYLCRQVRKYKETLHADAAQGFSVSEKAYRYEGDGIILLQGSREKEYTFR